MHPTFQIIADGKDVSKVLEQHLVNLSLTDFEAEQADVLSLTVDDKAAVVLPRTGVKLQLKLGYREKKLINKGEFVVDTCTLLGPPSRMTITAHTLDFGAKMLKERKSRHFEEITLKSLVATLAQPHQLKPAVSKSLANQMLTHLEQHNESDIQLLTRVAQRYGALAKATQSRLLLFTRDEAKKAQGGTIPKITLKPDDVTRYQAVLLERPQYQSVKAWWRDLDNAALKEAKAGSGAPVYVVDGHFFSEMAAQRAVEAAHRRFVKIHAELELELPGRAELIALAPLECKGFRVGVDGLWIITQVVHRVNKAGFVTLVQARVKELSKGGIAVINQTLDLAQGMADKAKNEGSGKDGEAADETTQDGTEANNAAAEEDQVPLSEQNPHQLRIERETLTEKSTIGRLYLDGEFFCHTLELPDKDNTRIPARDYEVVLSDQQLYIRNIPGRDDVRIQITNYPDKLQSGGIALGTLPKPHKHDEIWSSGEARRALITQLNLQPDERATLTIVDHAQLQNFAREITKLVVHHSATAKATTTAAGIKRYHVENRKWSDIAYHKVIEGDGRIVDGRPESKDGAHAYGANQKSLGVCVVGNFEKETIAEKQISALVQVLVDWCKKYHLDETHIYGHYLVPGGKTTTSCPGKNLKAKLDEVKSQIKQQLKNGS